MPWLSSWVISDQSKSRRERQMGKFFTPVCICRLLLHFPLWPILSKIIKIVFIICPFNQRNFAKILFFCNPSNFSEFRMKNVGRTLSKTAIVVFQESFFFFPLLRSICMSTYCVLNCVLGAARILLASKLEKVAFSTGLPNPLWPIKNLRKMLNFLTEPHCTLWILNFCNLTICLLNKTMHCNPVQG